MNVVEILEHVPLDLREFAERHANRFRAVQLVQERLGKPSESLLNLTDRRIPRWRWKKYGIYVEDLLPEERIQNLAERLVLAVRIRVSRSENSQPRR